MNSPSKVNSRWSYKSSLAEIMKRAQSQKYCSSIVYGLLEKMTSNRNHRWLCIVQRYRLVLGLQLLCFSVLHILNFISLSLLTHPLPGLQLTFVRATPLEMLETFAVGVALLKTRLLGCGMSVWIWKKLTLGKCSLKVQGLVSEQVHSHLLPFL